MINVMILHLGRQLSYLCPYIEKDLVRLGADTDGGYVVPERLVKDADFLLSFGLGNDWSFEQDFQTRNPSAGIHVYDGRVTLDHLPNNKKADYQEFFQGDVKHWPEMIGDQSSGNTTFSDAIARTQANQLFVKMDIEGGEFKCIDEIVAHHDKITGIAIEFHWTWANRPLFKESIDKLGQYYQIAHIHGTNSGKFGDDLLPDVLEVSYIRRDLTESRTQRQIAYLSNLDYPVDPLKSDYCLIFEL